MNRVRDLRVRPDVLYLASGWSTLVTDPHGRIDGGTQGFYRYHTRVLSRERITVDGREPVPFSTGNVGSRAQLSYAALGDSEQLPVEACYLLRERVLGDGLRTRLRVLSAAARPLTLTLGIELAADFADGADAERGRPVPPADVACQWDARRRELRLTQRHTPWDRAVVIRVEAGPPVRCDGQTLIVELAVAPRGEATVELAVEPVFDGRVHPAPPAGDQVAEVRAALAAEFTRLTTPNRTVASVWQTAIEDLASLPLGEPPGPAAPAAGLPLYQGIFGRDMLTASWQALLTGPTMLRDSLRLTAAWQGRRIDDWRDEEPGKGLHQARFGPSSLRGDDPHDAYYGDWATAPDFLVMLGQYLAWTGDRETVRRLLPAARRALEWLERYGDLNGDGFLEYRCRSAKGEKNQGWKDSHTAIVDTAGQVVDNPVAPSEVQAYWYAALRHSAFAFALCGDRAFAATLVAQAAALRRRFHRAFWLPECGGYAMALGPDGQPVRSASSNDGHLLAAGIVPARHAPAVARRLLSPALFSGWGVRTLAADHPAYDPFSYHRGAVWPVEAGTIALGLARYGRWTELLRVAEGLFAAAELFEGHRLPEVLGGLPRDRFPHPGIYPESCSPQAWSASAPIAVVQALLAFRPMAPLHTVLIDPHLPEWLPELTLEGVRVGRATFDLTVRRTRGGRVAVRVRGDPITVLRRPTLRSLRCRWHDDSQ